MRIPFEKMLAELERVLIKKGFEKERAQLCARLFTEASCDGVYSHGLNRFPRFIEYIEKGYVDIHAHPEKMEQFGALERWDGHLGPGNLNAHFCMGRAIDIARENGMGCVALQNTNHWMRPGAYGWQAADAGCIAMCWTNTQPNMPAWGSKERILGNNPLVIAVPRKEGHVVLDMAMSLYSYGKLESYRRKNEPLPYEGGFDEDGNLTRDAGAIEKSWRPLSIGYWKGSGLSLMLDLTAALLSGGQTTKQIGEHKDEYGLSQVFIAFDISRESQKQFGDRIVSQVIENLHAAAPVSKDGKIYYPGERTLLTRRENLKNGIPVDEHYWKEILGM